MNCYRCGFANAAGSRFCNNCGGAFNPPPAQQQRQKSSAGKWILGILISLALGSCAVSWILNSRSPESNWNQPKKNQSTKKQPDVMGTKRDRIAVNTICFLGPAGVFDTNDDITTYQVAYLTGDYVAASNMLSNDFHFWVREKASVRVLYHGPYQGYVAPDAPKSTRDALSQFEICQIGILDGAQKGKIGWVLDTDLRCPTNQGK